MGSAVPALSRRAAIVVLVGLACQFSALALVEAWRDSPTVDEPVYVAAGVTALTRRDLRINPEHPPLAKVLAALPALLARPVVPDGPTWDTAAQFDYVRDFFVANQRAGRLHRVTFASRVVPIGEAVAVGVLLYLLCTHALGRLAGVIGAAFWFTSPWVVGLGHVNGIDLPFTLSVLVGTLALCRHRSRPTLLRATIVGLCAGVTLLVRFTGIVAVPVFVLGVGLATGSLRRRVAAAGLVALVAWACVWIGLRAIAPAGPSGLARTTMAQFVERGRESGPAARLALAVPWPGEYAAGIGYQAVVAGERPVFLVGRAWTGWRWWYFPAAIATKVPLPVLAAGLAGSLTVVRVRCAATRASVAVACVLAAFTFFQPGQAGLRYLMPVVALGLIPASGIAAAARRPAGRLLLAGVGLIQLVALWTAAPHSLAWTTPPFRPGYRFASDSNLDWGQDIGRLAEWAKGRNPYVALFGPRGVTVPGTRPLREVPPGELRGWVAVSASALTTYDRARLAWLRKYCPIADIGGTILVYRFERPPTPEPGPAAPPPPCRNSPVSLAR